MHFAHIANRARLNQLDHSGITNEDRDGFWFQTGQARSTDLANAIVQAAAWAALRARDADATRVESR